MAGLYARVMRGLGRRGVRLFRFFVRPLGSADAPVPAGGTATVRVMPQDEVIGHCSDAALDLREEGVRAAYQRGDLCVGAYVGGRLAGYCWLAFGPLPHLDGAWVRFGEDVGWTYKSLVLPGHRGRGLAASLYRFGDEECRARGRTRSVICVESHNGPSVTAALRAGYLPGGFAGYLLSRSELRGWTSHAASRLGIAFFLPPA